MEATVHHPGRATDDTERAARPHGRRSTGRCPSPMPSAVSAEAVCPLHCARHASTSDRRERARLQMPDRSSDEPRFTRLIPPSVVAKIFNCTTQTLARWRWEGKGPPYVKLNDRVYYPENELCAFLGQLELRRSTSDRLPGPRLGESRTPGYQNESGAPPGSAPRVLAGRIPKFEGPLWNLDPSAGDEPGPSRRTRSRRSKRDGSARVQQPDRRSCATRSRRR